MSDVDLLALERWPEARRGRCARRASSRWPAATTRGRSATRRAARSWSCTAASSRRPGLFPLDPEGLWARSRAGRGQLRRLPSAEDLLLQLALHAAFQHGLVLSLVQWLDFRRVLEREAIDAGRLLALAGRGPGRGPARRRAARGRGGGRRAGSRGAAPARCRAGSGAGSPRASPTPLAFVAPSEPRLGRVALGAPGRPPARARSGGRSCCRRRPTATSASPRAWPSRSGALCASPGGSRPSALAAVPAHDLGRRPPSRTAPRCPSPRSCCASASPRSPTCG